MTKDELRKKLNEVAEWRMPTLSKTEIKESEKRARGRRSAEDRYQEEHEQVFLDMFNGINPTLTPELVKMNIKPQDCEDCGLHLAEGRQMEIKYYAADDRHIAHRRDRCKNCTKYKNPKTGQFDLPQGPAAQTFLLWARAEFNRRKKYGDSDTDK